MGDEMDPAKMKVVELRAELSSRGLDTKGVKAVLVDRLREALEKETGKAIQETSIMETSTEEQDDKDESEEDTSLSHKDKRQKLDDKPEDDDETIGENGNVQVKEDPDGPDFDKKQDDGKEQTSVKEEKHQTQEDVKIENVEDKKENSVTEEGTKDLKTEIKTEPQTETERRGEKRPHSPSRDRYQAPPDDEPSYDEKAVILSWYDSDLNLVIEKENFCVATPMFKQGFGYIWAGARSTYGFTEGKVYYEVKVLENCDVSHLEDEPNPHVLRVGWSVIGTSMQLGEEPLSFGYGGTGKASTDCKFKDFGKPFTEGDIVGAFLDMDDDSLVTMSYTLNGSPLGVAYQVPKPELEGKALFPHILSKNTKFECNFAGKESWCEPYPGYTFVGEVPLDKRVAGPPRPEKREDCEILMMCGLPACGKTTWANEWYAKNLDKMYNVLGTNSLIDKMKMMGLPRKRNYAGRWDVLIEKCTKCLNNLFEIAGRRRRNYILDQTNVYPNAQRRKMKGFEGFKRRAVVIVPTDEEFKKRSAQQEKVEGKDVPESAVLEMKANFQLPTVGDSFDEVRFIELEEKEARTLIDQYRKEAADAGVHPQSQRPRGFRGGGGGGGGERDRNKGGYQPRGGGDNKFRSSNWQSRRGGSGDGWRDRNQQYGSGRSNGPSGRDGGWRGGRGGRGNDSYSSRGFDRNRSSGGGGGYGNRNQSGGKGSWGGGYNQGGGRGGSWSGSDGGSGSWGQQSYGSQGSWDGQQNYNQQTWKGYDQQSGGYGGQGGYGQQQAYGQQGYGGGGGSNWNQQYYGSNQSYGGSQAYAGSTQAWGQSADGSYGGGYGQQQAAWQGYGQSYGYGQGQAPN